MVVEVGIGAILALGFVALIRTIGHERTLFAAALLLAAAAYLGFGLFSRFDLGLSIEIWATLAFAAMALLGTTVSLWFLAAGWALHGAWDIIIPALTDVSYMPSWYAGLCVGFDILVAAYLATRALGRLPISIAARGPHAA